MKSSAIKIGNRTYSIASVDDETFDVVLHQKGVAECDDIKSFIDYDDQLILVRNRLKADHRKELLLHEIIHACIEDSGASDESYERFVSVLSPRLVQVIDNIAVILDEAT